MEQAILGIDVSKATLDVSLLRGNHKLHQQFANSEQGYLQLAAWLAQNHAAQAFVCLEATGQYGDGIADYLFTHGHSVSVVNPARIKHYGNSRLRRHKTDKADAELIAEYFQRERPKLWSPPPREVKDLQALVRHLDDLQATRLQETNRLFSGVHTPIVVEQIQALIVFLDQQIDETKKAIQAHIDQFPALQHARDLLVTIPGIGCLTAAKLLGEVRDFHQFDSARQLAAYAGLTPRVFLSGTSVHKKSRLSKTGNTNLRNALYMPAVSAKRWNPIIRDFCGRLVLSGHKPKEVICAAMRKLLHLAYGVLKSDRPFDPDFIPKMQVAT